MAFHPFRLFQRNQKAWLAVIGIATMLSFILLPVLMQLFTRGGNAAQNVAKCRSYGNITSQHLNALKENRDTLRRFLSVLLEQLSEPANETKMNSLRPLMQYIRMYDQRLDSEQLVTNWLLSRYAQGQGIHTDWQVISDLLKQLTGGHLTDAIYLNALKNTGISQARLEYLFGEDIVRQHLLQQFQLSIESVSPATRWDWYNRLYRKVQIEAAAVPVAQFIEQVKDPTNAELSKFFEEYKRNHDDPASPEPGFVQPVELAFQYIVGEPSQKVKDSVTEDELKQFYEENKDIMFVKPKTPAEKPPFSMPVTIPGTEKKAPETPKEETSKPEEPAKPEEKAPETPKEETSKPEEPVKPEEKAPETPKEETSKPEEPAKPEEKAPETPKEETSKPEEKAPETPKEETAKPEESGKTSMSASVELRLVKYQTAKNDAEAPKNTEVKPADGAAPSADIPKTESKKEYVPFDEVKDNIRRILALRKAANLLEKIQEKMSGYARTYNDAFESDKPVPEIPDFSQLAADDGFELKKVPQGTLWSVLKTDFAKGNAERQRLLQLYEQVPMVFNSELFLGSQAPVLYWITAVKPEKKPENLDEVKDIAVKKWKEVQSRKFAQEKAEVLASEAKKADKALSDVLKDKAAVVETEAFSWKTYGAGVRPLTAVIQGRQPMLDEVREQGIAVGDSLAGNKVILLPGEEFMQGVFALPVGGVGVVLNQPKDTAYVVRVKNSTPSEDVLWDQFQTAFPLEYISAGQPEVSSDAYRAWLANIEQETGFHWVNKPEH